ncbi:MAG: VWA domain-containing protein [Deltaproteobacteria bacterium]|nr:MAG: VWA domain-containing protein [Deltaproteobacteria bacterium]
MSLLLFLWGCADTSGHRTAVYMLLDTSGTYRLELEKAEAIVKYLLGTLNPGDSLAVARIDSGSFSEKDIIEKVTFDSRPSYANQQKRLFLTRFQEFLSSVKGSSHTDITGGILQAAEFLNETGAGRKYILIFSDLEEDLQKGQIRDIPLQLKGIRVVALNVTKLRTDNIDPRKYMGRLATWEKRVLKGGGAWKVVNDLDRLDRILSD